MSDNLEKYPLTEEQAMEEASQMKQKIESGEAKTYNEAEKLVEEERVKEKQVEEKQVFSVEDIKKYAEDLKKKVEEAKIQKDKDIEKKLLDRETLIKEAENNDKLLKEAQGVLDYFTSVDKLGGIKDPEDIKRFEEIKNTVDKLEKRQKDIDAQIAAMENNPEILGKIQEEAKKEDIERLAEEEIKKAREQFYSQIDQLVRDIEILEEKKVFVTIEENYYRRAKSDSAYAKLRELFEQKDRMLPLQSRREISFFTIFDQSHTGKEMQQQLLTLRKKLGVFKMKEKELIDSLLSRTQEFEEFDRTQEKLTSLQQRLKELETEETSLKERYKTILLNSWEVQKKINNLTGKLSYQLPNEVSQRLYSALFDYKVSDFTEGKKEVGEDFAKWGEAFEESQELIEEKVRSSIRTKIVYINNVLGKIDINDLIQKEAEKRE
jgi:hypothetical protein